MAAVDEPIVVDAHTRLRPVAAEDALPLFALVEANRRDLRAWLPWLDSNTAVDATSAFIADAIRQNEAVHGAVLLIETDGVGCGVVGFNWIVVSNRNCGLGYWLAEEFRRRGVMTASVRALTHHAFEVLGMHRVSITAAVENRRSRAIPERLGFRQEGVLRDAEWLYDHFVDHALYAMLRHEWAPPLPE